MTRLERIREALKRSGADGLLVTSKSNRRYASRFASSAGAVFITGEKAYLIVDFRYIEAAGKGADPDFEVRSLKETFQKDIAALVEENGVKTVAFENNSMSVSEFESYKAVCKCSFVPFGSGMETVREIKEKEELEYIKTAQSITERAYAALLPQLHAGMTEKEVATILMYEMYKNGADGLSFPVIAVSGANSSLPHGVPTDKVIEDGDFLTMDFGAVYKGYCSDMTRTVAFGCITDEMKNVYETVLKAQLAAIEGAKAGMKGKAIDAIARDIISEAGYGECFQHGLGHCVGLDNHEGPRANKIEEKTLEKGHVLTIEPGIYIAGRFGVRIEDMIYFGENGIENLTSAPKELYIVK